MSVYQVVIVLLLLGCITILEMQVQHLVAELKKSIDATIKISRALSDAVKANQDTLAKLAQLVMRP